ncbi:uncharacterized protein LOC133293800 [Gastrolobium bilobum]|uniref:uncharacterized protein LOC133293800 n=1 Tax=Gastrolobium bilobum TaxID=150636 RepID=UPI002AB232B9|nr:uncharacterized protein LOC133293800 [Gastrolobium bilobum]
MLLRSSISSTKKFFQKTLKNFKSFFSPGYQRLPKTPPHNHFSYSVATTNVMDMNSNTNTNTNINTSYHDLEKLYTDFTDQWESEKEKTRRRSKKKAALSSPTKQENEVYNGSFINLSNASPSSQKKNQVEKREECENKNNMGRQQDSSFNSMGMKEHRYCMVEQKLRELEKLDMSNVDYVLDIEEVLHYYSRLTCPAYLEIVDKFFMEMYSDFFGPAWHVTPRSVNSRLKLRYQ